MNWIDCNLPWSDYSNYDAESFVSYGLNIPGTQIELENGDLYLIGDINDLGGVCDDCRVFERNAIVTRYRVVI